MAERPPAGHDGTPARSEADLDESDLAESDETSTDDAVEPAGLPAGTFAPAPVAAAVLVGVLAAVGLSDEPWPVVVGGTGLAALGVLLTVVDLRTHRLPDRLVGPGALWVLGTLAVAALVVGDLPALGRVVLAGTASAAGYLVLGLVRAGGLGLGDVKLAGVLGLWLGWFGWSAVLAGPVLAFLLGGFYAMALLVARRAGRESEFAFGPWMILGAALATAVEVTGALLR